MSVCFFVCVCVREFVCACVHIAIYSTVWELILIVCRGEFGDMRDKKSYLHLEPLDRTNPSVSTLTCYPSQSVLTKHALKY